MTNDPSLLDWIIRLAALLGLPGIIGKVLFDRRKIRAQNRRAETEADVDAAEAPLKVRTTSVVTLEAELAALAKTFKDDRELKEQTIQWLGEQLTEERRQREEEHRMSVAKDARIRELEGVVEALKKRVMEVSEELDRVHSDLRSMHGEDGPHT